MNAHVQDHLSAYLDGELAVGERFAVETHLRSCPDCARHLQELRAVDEVAREIDPAAPPGYFDSLPARVRARLPGPRRRAPPPWVWAAAAAVVLAALTPLTVRRTTSPVPEAAPTREAEGIPAAPAPAPPATAAPHAEALRSDDTLGAARDEAATEKERNAAAERGLKPSARASVPRERDDAKLGAPAVGGRLEERVAKRPPPPPPPSVQKHSGPWAQSPAAPQAQSQAQVAAREEIQVEAAPETKKQAEAAGKSDRDQARAGALADAAAPAAPAFAQAPGEDRYRALLGRQASSPEAARRLHDDWDAFARAHPDSPRADEARVRALDALLAAFQRGGDARDRDRLREEAEAYLKRSDAAQPARVRAILAAAGLPR